MRTQAAGAGLRRTIFAMLQAFCQWRGAIATENAKCWQARAMYCAERAR